MSAYQQSIKISNKFLVLQSIKNHEPISRAHLSQQLNLTKATVSSLVEELIEEGYCHQTGPGKSSGGRRPLMLKFNEKTGYSIGIDIGVNYVLGILTDLRGNIMFEKNQKMNTNDFNQTILFIEEVISEFIQKGAESNRGVIGIGIGVPGIVNLDGNVLYTPNLQWEQADLKNIISEKYSLPVIVENEANAGAYGEKCFGVGKESADLVYISLGIGIGTGLILDNKLYRGKSGLSGELGHMIIESQGKLCGCGSKGCWELYASERALINRAHEVLGSKYGSEPSLEGLMAAARKDHEVKTLFDEIGYYLGVGINNIINTFNPEQIIIGNRLTIAKDHLHTSLMQVIKEKTLNEHQTNLTVNYANLSQYSTALGVSAYSIEHYFKEIFQTDIAF